MLHVRTTATGSPARALRSEKGLCMCKQLVGAFRKYLHSIQKLRNHTEPFSGTQELEVPYVYSVVRAAP